MYVFFLDDSAFNVRALGSSHLELICAGCFFFFLVKILVLQGFDIITR